MRLTINCSAICSQEQKIEQKLAYKLDMRLRAVRRSGRFKFFDLSPHGIEDAWAWARPDGQVMRWIKEVGGYLPTAWPAPFMLVWGKPDSRQVRFFPTREYAELVREAQWCRKVFEEPVRPWPVRLVDDLFP